MASWKDRAQPVKTGGSWKDRAESVVTQEDQPSIFESLGRGAAQGASLGFEDELAGLGGALGYQAGKLGVDEVKANNPELQAKMDLVASQENGKSFGDLYRESRDQERATNEKASDANPTSYLGGSLLGAVANPISQISSLPGVVGTGAAMGLGSSTADLTDPSLETIGKAGLDTALGAGSGAAGYGVAKALPKIWDGVKYFGKKGLTTLGPTEEAINARLAGNANSSTKTYGDLAESLPETLKKLRSTTDVLSEEAGNVLSQEPAIPKERILDSLDEAVKGLQIQGQTVGATDKAAANTLSGLKDDLSLLDGMLSEKDLKGIIKKLDDNINWDDQSQNKLNGILQGIRTDYDKALKFRNPSYREMMKPVAENTRLMEDLRRQFNLKGVPGKGLQPTDTTASKIQTAIRDNGKDVTQGNLEQLRRLTGDDYLEKANDYRLASQFNKTEAQGAKRTVLGGALGSMVGSAIAPGLGTALGGGIGAGVGSTLDRYGGKVVGELIDNYLKVGNSAAFGKFKPIIEKAAAEGPRTLGVVSSMLANNPEFKKQVGLE